MIKFLSIFTLFMLPSVALAATFHLMPPVESIRAGDEFLIEVFFDSVTDQVNALEGSLVFGDSLLLKNIRFAGSVVPLWVSRPIEIKKGVVTFAGVLPGGYQGSSSTSGHGNLFTLVFEAASAGVETVSFSAESAVYKNDGQGTLVKLAAPPLPLVISSPTARPRVARSPVDRTHPEPFMLSVISAASFNREGTAVVFSTVDKDSGIAGFEVAHSFFPYMPERFLAWESAESPYFLTPEDKTRFVYIRAIDKMGNTTGSFIDPVDNPALGWGMRGILTLLMFGVGFLFSLVLYARYKKDLR